MCSLWDMVFGTAKAMKKNFGSATTSTTIITSNIIAAYAN